MHTRFVDGITIRPLRNGDVATVAALFERVGGGPKARLSVRELDRLARVDGAHHALVAFVPRDPAPAALAHLVRDGRGAELAFAVADVHRGRSIGPTLVRELAADALAAGITELRATVGGDDPRVVSLLRPVTGSAPRDVARRRPARARDATAALRAGRS